ncbi:hypothetical protein CANCADRAFT_30973 [Tortispora caseinolytica NRRL Y-17796]|uniref:Uncharacterized protein n=1 Tax=Tortispora caseinolytica NRRL Y-17796 TaxID=767744 RepID=A0A1E4TDR3_9ASCO|nr:hypothetical protein CANCADRAFT_30973 [Tortispora caseinolytica NRRL Y-17796]
MSSVPHSTFIRRTRDRREVSTVSVEFAASLVDKTTNTWPQAIEIYNAIKRQFPDHPFIDYFKEKNFSMLDTRVRKLKRTAERRYGLNVTYRASSENKGEGHISADELECYKKLIEDKLRAANPRTSDLTIKSYRNTLGRIATHYANDPGRLKADIINRVPSLSETRIRLVALNKALYTLGIKTIPEMDTNWVYVEAGKVTKEYSDSQKQGTVSARETREYMTYDELCTSVAAITDPILKAYWTLWIRVPARASMATARMKDSPDYDGNVVSLQDGNTVHVVLRKYKTAATYGEIVVDVEDREVYHACAKAFRISKALQGNREDALAFAREGSDANINFSSRSLKALRDANNAAYPDRQTPCKVTSQILRKMLGSKTWDDPSWVSANIRTVAVQYFQHSVDMHVSYKRFMRAFGSGDNEDEENGDNEENGDHRVIERAPSPVATIVVKSERQLARDDVAIVDYSDVETVFAPSPVAATIVKSETQLVEDDVAIAEHSDVETVFASSPVAATIVKSETQLVEDDVAADNHSDVETVYASSLVAPGFGKWLQRRYIVR